MCTGRMMLRQSLIFLEGNTLKLVNVFVYTPTSSNSPLQRQSRPTHPTRINTSW